MDAWALKLSAPRNVTWHSGQRIPLRGDLDSGSFCDVIAVLFRGGLLGASVDLLDGTCREADAKSNPGASPIGCGSWAG